MYYKQFELQKGLVLFSPAYCTTHCVRTMLTVPLVWTRWTDNIGPEAYFGRLENLVRVGSNLCISRTYADL